MLDRSAQHTIRHTCERTSRVILRQRQRSERIVDGLEISPRKMEATELDGDTGTDADEGCQGTFVEREGTLLRVD